MSKCCNWIKQNPALAAGIFLPALLVVFFSLGTIIPQMLVPPPAYDLLFTASSYNGSDESELRFNVVDNKLKAEYRAHDKKNYSNTNQRLYRVDVKTLTVNEIKLDIPSVKPDDTEWKVLEVQQAKGLNISSETVAPDGYQFANDTSNAPTADLFYSYRNRRDRLVLLKDGRAVTVKFAKSANSYSATTLGWVVPEGSAK